ncbi:unnamed protein product [Candidula unifasciata]|uniref:Cytochrome P450 n=1 Tax=Candidula unifasciata TaxID=100452 RepID=A0A8S3ZF60_9EUPU|nr:unnamed protein product [Candidula unifasciata]
MMSLLEQLLLTFSALTSTTYILAVLAAVAAVIYYIYSNDSHDDWRRYGVKCPKFPAFFFLGDLKTQITEAFQKYGDTIGLPGRGRLVLLTTNFDLLRQILIKDFNNFIDRSDRFPSISPFGKSLFFAKGADWKRHRQIVSPTFASGKLKYISKSIEKSAADLTNYLEKAAKEDQIVPIKELAGQYTCEIIAKTAFGIDAKFIGEKDPEFYEYAKNMLHLPNRQGISKLVAFLLSTVPKLMDFSLNVLKLQYFDVVDHKANDYFGVSLRNTMAERRQLQKSGSARSHVDFLDLLMKANDAAATGNLPASEDQTWEQHQDGKSVQGLSEEEMIGHSMLIIFAGMETTATTLQMCLAELALHPDIQEKVFKEITSVVKSETPTHEELNSLTYMEQVINETLRMYPPVSMVTRIAKETRTYNGVTIPNGTMVQIPYFYILNDPKNFPEPQKFDPNRFSQEEKEKRDPLSFAAFGHGPRLCLGMRLAILELKQGLVHVLRKLKVVLNENTEPQKGSNEIKFTLRGLLTPDKTILLRFELRKVDS